MRILFITFMLTFSSASPVYASEWFDLEEYYRLKVEDEGKLSQFLGAMYETAFYARNVVEGGVICATPKPPTVQELMSVIEEEIQRPTNTMQIQYDNNSHVAFILVNGLVASKQYGCN
ncbi:MAG: hypothetical protein RIF37_18025 [Rhodospirillaceae bacterium]